MELLTEDETEVSEDESEVSEDESMDEHDVIDLTGKSKNWCFAEVLI